MTDGVMPRPSRSALFLGATLSILIAIVSACGGGGSGEVAPPGPATVSTLAYVVNTCSGDDFTIRQSLQIRRGDEAPITVVEHSALLSFDGVGTCVGLGDTRYGPAFGELGVFRRLGVSPDGSQVVFEVTDEVTAFVNYPLAFPANALPAEENGIFVVGADGTGLRRLGPASREVSYHKSLFVFSPNGRTIAYTDRGPSAENEDAAQIVTLDLVSGEHQVTQVTHLPPPTDPTWPETYDPFFNDDETITFSTHANADGNHPDGENIVVTVKTDGTGLTVAQPAHALPGSELLTSFRITGSELDAAVLTRTGMAENWMDGYRPYSIREVFDIDRDNILQLTNFHRTDTYYATVTADGQRVLFTASANPPELGTNPDEVCQLFSIDRSGDDLRQLTTFHDAPEGQHERGCNFWKRPLGCWVGQANRDIRTDAVLFYSSCDPLGTNPYGSQVFAMHADGTGLRQLTNTAPFGVDASGAFTVELPFPFAWPGREERAAP